MSSILIILLNLVLVDFDMYFMMGFERGSVYLLTRWCTGALANVFVLFPRSRSLPGPSLGCVRGGCRAGSSRPGARLAHETSFDMCYVPRAEQRMSGISTTAGSVGRSHFGGHPSRGTQIRRSCGSMTEN